MTVWRCPKCPYTVEQPEYVTAIRHRCNPAIPRSYPLTPDPITTQKDREPNVT